MRPQETTDIVLWCGVEHFWYLEPFRNESQVWSTNRLADGTERMAFSNSAVYKVVRRALNMNSAILNMAVQYYMLRNAFSCCRVYGVPLFNAFNALYISQSSLIIGLSRSLHKAYWLPRSRSFGQHFCRMCITASTIAATIGPKGTEFDEITHTVELRIEAAGSG